MSTTSNLSPIYAASLDPLDDPQDLDPATAPRRQATVESLPDRAAPQLAPTDTREEPSQDLAARATKARRILLAAVFTLGMGVIGMKALGAASSAKLGSGASISSPGATLLTEDLVRLLSDTPNATSVAGSYVPGVGLVISLSVDTVAADAISLWWSTTVAPIAPRFAAELPNDRIVVLIQSAGSGGFSRTIVLPTGSIADVAGYRLASAVFKDPNPASSNTATTDTSTATANANTSANPATFNTQTLESAASFATPSESAATTPLAPTQSTPNLPTETVLTPTPSPPDALKVPVPTSVALAIAAPGGAEPTSATRTALSTDVLEGFDKASSKWTPMSGQWKFLGGSYQQIDNSGFDFISQYTDILPTDFSVSIKLAAIEGDMNGGLLLFQQALGKRNEATIVDLTSSSQYLRWGHYDLGGVYVFDGGAKISALVDQAKGVLLRIEVRGNTAVVFLNDTRIGEFTPTKKGGTAGLISSQAKIRFDDFTIRPLP